LDVLTKIQFQKDKSSVECIDSAFTEMTIGDVKKKGADIGNDQFVNFTYAPQGKNDSDSDD
jgi:hypothetical protein